MQIRIEILKFREKVSPAYLYRVVWGRNLHVEIRNWEPPRNVGTSQAFVSKKSDWTGPKSEVLNSNRFHIQIELSDKIDLHVHM